MNIFERLFTSKQELSSDEQLSVIEESTTETVQKNIESIKDAKASIASLEEKRKENLTKHRDTVEALKALEVNDKADKGIARSETYNALLNPIEQELAAISTELDEKRTEFDLQPSRVTMLENRISRLEDLKAREETQFSETEIGKEIAEYDKEIDTLTEEIARWNNLRLSGGVGDDQTLIHEKEKSRDEISQKISTLYRDDKIAHTHSQRMQKIQTLMIDTDWGKRNAKDASYDENGQIRIK